MKLDVASVQKEY